MADLDKSPEVERLPAPRGTKWLPRRRGVGREIEFSLVNSHWSRGRSECRRTSYDIIRRSLAPARSGIAAALQDGELGRRSRFGVRNDEWGESAL